MSKRWESKRHELVIVVSFNKPISKAGAIRILRNTLKSEVYGVHLYEREESRTKATEFTIRNVKAIAKAKE
jgi:hypothetical protein